jgi:hypothetical protein
MSTGNIRTRIAPSPTGEFHIGSLRTLLYNFAWAKNVDQGIKDPAVQQQILELLATQELEFNER